MENWFEELMSQHRRRALRHMAPHLVAFYWEGGASQPRQIRDVSDTGFYLFTDQRWSPGALITMTLQRTQESGDGSAHSIAVRAKVIRVDDDGVAMAFVFPKPEDARSLAGRVADEAGLADKKMLDRFLQPLWINRRIEPENASS
jgi:hypothetical protein